MAPGVVDDVPAEVRVQVGNPRPRLRAAEDQLVDVGHGAVGADAVLREQRCHLGDEHLVGGVVAAGVGNRRFSIYSNYCLYRIALFFLG